MNNPPVDTSAIRALAVLYNVVSPFNLMNISTSNIDPPLNFDLDQILH